MWWILLAAALAQDCDEGKGPDLETAVAEARAAIYEADADGHDAVIGRVFAQLGCLESVPDPELWAKLLLGHAISSFSTGGDWESPLTTALRIQPDIDRLVGAGHPIASFTPPPPPEQGAEVPEGVRLYVDGERVSHLPAPVGLHLLQLRDGDGWRNVLAKDEAVPEAWLVERSLGREARHPFAVVSAAVGGGAVLLDTSESVDFVEGYDSAGLQVGGRAHASVPIAGPVSIAGDAWVGWSPGGLGVGGYLGPGLLLGPVEVSAGPALQAVPLTDSDGTRLSLLPLPALRVLWRSNGRFQVDAGLGGGATAAAAAAWAQAGLSGPGRFTWRAGLDARMHLGFYEAEADATQTATAGIWTVTAQIGLALR